MSNDIFRYKLSSSILELVNEFAIIHKYDDRKQFKEEWKEYTDLHKDLFQRECDLLLQNGFKKDPMVKIFKSCRYYFRQKSNKEVKPKDRKVYKKIPKEMLDLMDSFLNENKGKPSDTYELFINKYNDVIYELYDSEEYDDYKLFLQHKIKKTYKNRFNIQYKSY